MLRSSLRGAATTAAVIVFAALAASCSTTENGRSPVANAIFGAPNPGTQNAIIVSADTFGTDYSGDCPPVAIRPGTEALQVFEPGKKIDPITGAQPPLVYQASITNTARECRKTATGVGVKLGVSGRVVAGPAGKAGTVTVPLRIVVLGDADKVVTSEVVRIPVALDPTSLSGDFTKIDETIDLPITPDNNNFRIYVGYDDSAMATPAKKKRKG